MGIQLCTNMVQRENEMLLGCALALFFELGKMGVDIPLRGRIRELFAVGHGHDGGWVLLWNDGFPQFQSWAQVRGAGYHLQLDPALYLGTQDLSQRRLEAAFVFVLPVSFPFLLILFFLSFFTFF